ncbi:uncharacterized protein LOC133393100 isoform X1 [Anopheles gambiae]|uniref:uncharacterized protein LOC133393100 isoform X1 n=1 Tax=Anopheles gambiae TaxID=7165 RepID=UPI002AC9A99D|nr:uncharacterized protein LOC133393100 isoform X1 [Anopheles gambiae]
MEICFSLLLQSIAILGLDGLPKRRWKFSRELLLSRCCLLALLLVLCCQLTPTVQGVPRRHTAKAYDAEEGYYESDGSYEEDDDEQHYGTGETIHHGSANPHDDNDSVEIEYEEHDEHHHHHHLPNGVAESDESSEEHTEDAFNNANLLAQLGIQQKLPDGYGKSKKKGKHYGPPPVTIAVPYPVHIERKVPVFIEKKVPVIVEKQVEVPVDRPYEVPVPVKVPVHEKEVIHVPKPIVFNVDRPYPVFVHRTVFVDKYRPFKVLIKSRTRY